MSSATCRCGAPPTAGHTCAAPTRRLATILDREFEAVVAPVAKPRVVVIHGILGSALRQRPAVDTCDSVLRAPLPIPSLPGITLPAFTVGDALCPLLAPRLDPSFVWGTDATLLWLLGDSARWSSEMIRGDGLSSSGGLVADRFLNMVGKDPYGPVVGALRRAGCDVLSFAYDWRLSNHVHVPLLEAAIRARWPRIRGGDDRVTIVAHSMGGLVARALIENRGGHRLVKRLVTAGTPHHGAPEAFTHLAGSTSPFATIIDVTTLRDAAAVASRLVPGLAPPPPWLVDLTRRSLAPFAQGQKEMVERFASTIQLMPDRPFRRVRGGLEPLATSFKAITHNVVGAPGESTESLHQRLHGLLAKDLSTQLPGLDVEYHLIASSGQDTIVEVEDVDTPVRRAIGDGKVPFSSATGAGLGMAPGFLSRITLGNAVVHQDLLRDPCVIDIAVAVATATSAPGSPPTLACVAASGGRVATTAGSGGDFIPVDYPIPDYPGPDQPLPRRMPVSPVPPAQRPRLRQGSRGEWVSRAQERLNLWRGQAVAGPAPLVVDGIFGPKTDGMVRAFQRDQAIDADGVVGPITWGRLDQVPVDVLSTLLLEVGA